LEPDDDTRTLDDPQPPKVCAEGCFRFLDSKPIELTNKTAERALRHPAIDRRITQGSRGETGSRWLERFWSIRETRRQQDRPLFDHLVQAITRHTAGQPPA
jgi:hypothetical protein